MADWMKEPPREDELTEPSWMDKPPEEDELKGHLSLDEKPTKLQSAGRGILQGASLGFADEITGGAEALWEKAKGNPLAFGKLYEKSRNESRANFKKAKDANPKSYTAGELGGGVATAILPAGAAANLGRAAVLSMGMGGAAGLGSSEADNLVDQGTDMLKGAGIGLGGGVLGYGAAKAVPWAAKTAGDKLKFLAELASARAQGAERGTIKSLGMDKVRAAGRQGLDEKLFGPLSSTKDMIARNEAAKEKGGKLMGKVYEAIDAADASTFNPREVAEKVDDKIGGFWRDPINQGEANQYDKTIQSILDRGPGDIPLSEAQLLKETVGKTANWKNNVNLTDKERMARDAYGVISGEIDDAVKLGQRAVDDAGLGDTLKRGKELYSNASTSDALLENRQAREEGNKLLGITDWSLLGGGLGAAVPTGGMSIPATLAMTAAKKGLEKYGAQNTALLTDKVSKFLLSSPKMQAIAKTNPPAFKAIAASIAQRASENLPKVAGEPEKQIITDEEAQDKFIEGN